MKVAVAGSSGFIGDALVRRWQQQGHRVFRLVRHSAGTPNEIEWHPGFGEIRPRNALDGFDVVVNLAGASLGAGRWSMARKTDILVSRIESTRTLVAAMAPATRRPAVFISASAVGYYGDRGDNRIAELSGSGTGFLARVCRAWEQEAAEAGRAGIRTVLLRFGMVLGRDGGALARLAPAFRWGLGHVLGDGLQWVSWVALADALRAIDHAVQTPALNGPVNVVSPQPVLQLEFAGTLARVLGRPCVAKIPAILLRGILGEMAEELLLASVRAHPQRLADTGFAFEQARIAEALRVAAG